MRWVASGGHLSIRLRERCLLPFLARHNKCAARENAALAGCATASGRWQTDTLIPAGDIHQRVNCVAASAQQTFSDDGIDRKICQRCSGDWRLGRESAHRTLVGVTRRSWRGGVRPSSASVYARAPPTDFLPRLCKAFPVGSQSASGDSRIVPRPLARHIPQDKEGVLLNQRVG